MTPKVLLIDDERDFKMDTDSWDVHIARNSQEALMILRNDNSWDSIWFDHDLGMVHGAVDTTIPVVDLLAEKAFIGEPVNVGHIFVHTANAVGAK